MAKEQTALSFGKGITNVPSDATCDDNALEECVGMVYEGGEHRVIQKPKSIFEELDDFSGTIVFVHNLPTGQKNYIYVNPDDDDLYYFSTDASCELIVSNRQISHDHLAAGVDGSRIKAIGKTLIVATGEGLCYYLWKPEDSDYSGLGSTIPRPRMTFALKNDKGRRDTAYTNSQFTYLASDETKIVGLDAEYHLEEGYTRADIDNSCLGAYAAAKKLVARNEAFCLPFVIRYALEMYDGQYMHISNPVVMFPCLSQNHWMRPSLLYILPMSLYYRNLTTYEDWTDIVKKITVFVSAGVEIYELGKGAYVGPSESSETEEEHDYIVDTIAYNGYVQDGRVRRVFAVHRKSDNEIAEDVMSVSTFYKLCDIKATEMVGNYAPMDKHFRYDVLENITTQDQLKYDNYYSLAPLTADYLYTYNNRLNLAKVSRGFFEGFDDFVGIPRDHPIEGYDIYVSIVSENGVRVVKAVTGDIPNIQGRYFFYPDPRARQVTIYKNDQGRTLILNADLEEHPGLNGAYYFGDWPSQHESPSFEPVNQDISTKSPLTDDNLDSRPESLNSYIFTSEVNNPFLFKSEGANKVGSGAVIGLATQTVALSDGTEFGSQPLVVFTDKGLWSLSVSKEGLYSAGGPMPREVCNNPKSITEVDGVVFFSSAKGLMAVVGSQVKCVSEQLSGRSANPFQTYLKDAYIAYDYRDSLLWIFNNERYCWIYSIKSGTFARYDFGQDNTIGNVVPDYPDYLLQSGGKVYSLLNRPDINHDGETVGDSFVANTYDATIVTRPMKFENAMALKSIRQIRNVHYMEGRLRYRLFASNDLKRWVELKSLRGMPWKYFKMRFDFTDLKATDRFAGTVVVTDERNTNKLR